MKSYILRLILTSATIALYSICQAHALVENPLYGYEGYTNCYFLSYSKGSFDPSSDGDVFVDINFGGITNGGETNLDQIGGVTVHNIQVDTGSRGLYISSDLVTNVVTTNADSWMGTNYLSSSKRVFIGHYIKTPVNFQVTDQNSNPTIATANIPVLVVESLGSFSNGSPTYSMKDSRGKVTLTNGKTKSYTGGILTLTGGEAVYYSNNVNLGANWNFGVGFGPHTNESSPSGPVGNNTNQIYNAFINLTTMNQAPENGGMVAGYILENDKIQLGLTESTVNFAYTQLSPSGYTSTNSVPDWKLSSGEVVANGVTNGPVTILMDAGIGYSFLSTDIISGWLRHHSNSLSINLVNSVGLVGYRFHTDAKDKNAQSDNIVAPAGVTNNGSMTSLFLNTGRHVFYGFDMLYDAQNGYIGVITNTLGSQDTNVFFESGFYPAPGSDLRKQTITFPTIPAKKYGDTPFTISATSTSKLPVSYTVQSGPATITGSKVTLTGTGDVSILAFCNSNSVYLPGNTLQTINVAPANQTITFVSPSARTYSPGGTFGLVATAHGGVVTFISNNTNVISITGSTANINGAGSALITAQQDGSTNYSPAPPVNRTATISKAAQAISFPMPQANFVIGTIFQLNATSTSGLGVSFASSNPKVISVTGTSASVIAKGTASIIASQLGDPNWKTAPSVSRAIRVE